MRRRVTEKLVLPSDIKSLPELTAFLKIPNFDLAKIRLAYKQYPSASEPFIMRPGWSLEQIKQQAAGAAEKEGDTAPTGMLKKQESRDRQDKGEDLEGDIFMVGA